MKPDDQSATAVTVVSLSDGDWSIRLAALSRLPADQPIPFDLIPALVGLLAAPESHQRAEVVSVVSRIGAPVVPHLIAVLKDAPPEAAEFRRAAVVALGRLGPIARPSVPLLLEAADDPWLGPCVRSALAAIEPITRRDWPLLFCTLLVVMSFASLALARQPLNGGPEAMVVGVVGLSVAFGIWWTRPKSALGVSVFLVVIAMVMAMTAAGGVTRMFERLSRAMVSP